MNTFTYRAMTHNGEQVSGTLSAANRDEVARRIDYLGLLPIEIIMAESAPADISGTAQSSVWVRLTRHKPTAEELSSFSRDLALVLNAGAPIDRALTLLLSDTAGARMVPVLRAILAAVTSGESFAAALSHHPDLFPGMYLALVKVGEASGALPQVLDALAQDSQRNEMLRRKITDALRYPAFVLCAAGAVLTFFLTFVLPQFGAILRDFNAKLDPLVAGLLTVSDVLTTHEYAMLALASLALLLLMLGWRHQAIRQALRRGLFSLPVLRGAAQSYHTDRFCRALSLLLHNGVPLNRALNLLDGVMADIGGGQHLGKAEQQLRQGERLSDALPGTGLPALAINMIRLGEETSEVAMLSGKVAELYELKLERRLEQIVGFIGPAAILGIATLVGGLIVSIMTSLMSINQIVQ